MSPPIVTRLDMERGVAVDIIMQIIRQAQARMRATGSSQWQDGYPAPGHISADIGRGCGYVLCRPGVRECRAIIAYGAVAFDGEPAYEALEGEWLTEGDSSNSAYAVVHRVAVAADSVGKGAARLMLGNAQNLAHEGGAQSLRVDTHPGNVPMLSLLRSSGFTECGIIRIKHAGGLTPERVAFEKLL